MYICMHIYVYSLFQYQPELANDSQRYITMDFQINSLFVNPSMICMGFCLYCGLLPKLNIDPDVPKR